MSKPGAIRQGDVQRAVRAALACGLPVQRVEVAPSSGKIVIYTCEAPDAPPATNDWDADGPA